jgi:hypothetical protein
MVITVPFSHLGNGVGDLGYLGLGVGEALGTWDVLVVFGIYLRIYLGYLRNLGYFDDRVCK